MTLLQLFHFTVIVYCLHLFLALWIWNKSNRPQVCALWLRYLCFKVAKNKERNTLEGLELRTVER